MKKKFLIFLCLILFIVSITSVSAVEDANQTTDVVSSGNTLSDGEIVGSADGGTFTDLQKMIDDADENSTIYLETDYKCGDGYAGISISKSITIDGQGHALDGEREISILHISSDGVVLKNITFVNSIEDSAILIDGNNAVISDCTFMHNGAFNEFGSSGGAIKIYGNNTIISGCHFEDNSVSSSIGGAYGGAISCVGSLTILNSSFISNGVSSSHEISYGGAVDCDGNLTVIESTFISNEANSDLGSGGGAIYSRGNLTIFNSSFISNVANVTSDDSKGGAVYCLKMMDIKGSGFINNSADEGQAIWAYEKYSSIENCTFINNNCKLVYFGIYAPNLVKYYLGPERFFVYLTDSGKAVANKIVYININGITYERRTDENGSASIAVNLNSGKYDAIVRFDDLCVNSTVTIESTILGNDITKIFRNGTQYYATFRDSNGNLLGNADVNFNINGVFYTRTTDANGVARMNINLNPDEYIITAINPSNGESQSNIITVLPNIVENRDLTKYYKNASQFTFRLLDDQGKPVGEGVDAQININGVFYTRQTNASGYVNMNINLDPGTYIATIQYNGLMMSNTVEVLPVLEAKDISMKYKDGTKFEAKLLDGQGNPFANQTITFNIHGVFYNRTTDENGVAGLNINLMPGEYIITSMYSNGATISNKIEIE